jgi:hypothetical protein
MYANGLLPFVARRYGRCCMYGPNYVKLSRAFAVQLFGVIIEHYTTLPPVGLWHDLLKIRAWGI